MSVSRSISRSRFGDVDQHRVAGRVAEAVVDLLEVVDVDQEQRVDRLLRLAAAPALGCARAASRMNSWK